jgi:transposase
VHIFEREVDGRRYRVAAQSVWDSTQKRSVSRQVTLGPVEPAGNADLGVTFTVGTKRVGDVGALASVAEKLDLVDLINRACGGTSKTGPSIGEMVLAVAVQRATAPGPKRDLAEFLEGSLPRVSCLPASAFSGQVFHRLAGIVTAAQLDAAQIEIARAAVKHFKLSTDVLAFDTTNFDTHIATATGGDLAQRGHAKSKRNDLRVVGLGLLVSETGHVPLLHHTYPGNGSDQGVLDACLENLGHLHDALDQGEGRKRPAQRTLVRDGGFWSEQLELTFDVVGYYSLISLPMSHRAAEEALSFAAKRGSMRALSGPLSEVRVARLTTKVGELNRTLLVVESKALLDGQKRGIAVALTKAQREFVKLERHVDNKKISRSSLEHRVKKALRREHLATFVVTEIAGTEAEPTFTWRVDAERRKALELKRLGRRVLCTDQHSWSSERIVTAFRGQWNVEELFRRAKGGVVVPWGPSFQWVDSSLRLHTFASVIGLMLVSLARLALGTEVPTHDMMERLGAIEATLVRTSRAGMGRRLTVHLAPELDSLQRRAVKVFELERWLPALSSAMALRKKSGASSSDA